MVVLEWPGWIGPLAAVGPVLGVALVAAVEVDLAG
jgi:hypothetical protein